MIVAIEGIDCVSPLVKDKEAVFLTDLEEIAVVDPKDVKFVIDRYSFFRRTQLYLESQWRQQIPTDTDIHIGDKHLYFGVINRREEGDL